MPNKPIFLKDLAEFVHFVGLSSLEYILLIDDNPFKNLMNDLHSVVFPQPFFDDIQDNYFKLHLVPKLNGLFKSSEAVLNYVKSDLLYGGQSSMDPLSKEGYLVLLKTIKE